MKQVVVKQKHSTHRDTLDDCFLAWIMEKKIQGRANETLDNYTFTYTKFCEFNGFAEDTLPSAIDEHVWHLWVMDMEQSGMSVSSVNHHIKQLRVFIHYLMKRGDVVEFDMPEVKGQEPKIKCFTDEEIERLLRKPKNMNDFVEVRMWVITNLICATGARSGSVRSVRMGDVDMVKGFINFPHTKNRKTLRLPISRALYPILKQYIAEWRSDTIDDDFLFPDIGNNELSANAIRCAFTRYCERRGVARTSIHSLRHSFARNFILNNGQPYQLMEILGHASYDTTKRYVRIFGEDLQNDWEQFSLLDTHEKTQKRPNKQIKRTN